MTLLLTFLIQVTDKVGDEYYDDDGRSRVRGDGDVVNVDSDENTLQQQSWSSMLMTILLGIVLTWMITFAMKVYRQRHQRKHHQEMEKEKFQQNNYIYPTLLDRPILEVAYNLSSTTGLDYFLQQLRNVSCDNKDQKDNHNILRFPFHIGTSQFYLVGNHNIARQIFDDPKSVKESIIYSLFDNTSGGKSFFTTDTAERSWHVRKVTSNTFSTQNLKRQTHIVEDIVEKWKRTVLEPSIINKRPLDIAKEMSKITLQVIITVGFGGIHGYSDSAQGTGVWLTREEEENCSQWLDDCYVEFGRNAGRNPLHRVPYLQWIYPTVRRAKNSSWKLQRMAKRLLDSHRINKKKRGEKNMNNQNNGKKKVATSILEAIDDDPQYKSDHERVCDLVVYLVGGFDTTANTLAWIFWDLTEHPVELEKLQSVLSDYGDTNHHNDGTTAPTNDNSDNSQKNTTRSGDDGDGDDDDGRDCQTIKHIIRESLRLHPTAPLGSVRKTARDIVVAEEKIEDDDDDDDINEYKEEYGIHENGTEGEENVHRNGNNQEGTKVGKKTVLPANSYCLLSAYMIGRQKEVFGDNVDTFVPSRWEDITATTTANISNGEGKEKHSIDTSYEEKIKACMPFAAGRRSCQGQGLAMLEIKIVLARLFRNYQWERVEDGMTDYFVTLKRVGALYQAKKIRPASTAPPQTSIIERD